MIGIFFGIASVYLLVRLVRGARHRRHGGWGGFGRRARRFGRFGGGGWMLGRLFEELETTPAQEREIRAALDEVFSEARTMKGEWRRSREDLAAALDAPEFDAEALTAGFARQDSALDDVRRVVVGAAARVHAVLEPAQRERLVRWLGHHTRLRGAGPYREAV